MQPLRYSIIDSTLREGEQCQQAFFTTRDKIEIATALAEFGVEYIELTSPRASPRSERDCRTLCSFGLESKMLTHIRCHPEDARIAMDVEPDGINLCIGVSPKLRESSHGLSIDQIIERAADVLHLIRTQAPRVEIRLSAEDAFRCPVEDLERLYGSIAELGLVDRFGIADTTGGATPGAIYETVGRISRLTGTDLEFHAHNDTDCAVANSYMALEAGATHIDTTVLGIGERNGIASLEGFIAKLYALMPQETAARYRLDKLTTLSALVAQKLDTQVPVNHPIVGDNSFSHKAGIHTKAVLRDSSTYELFAPDAFGVNRSVLFAHNLTGWNAIETRAAELGLKLSQRAIKKVTGWVKDVSDSRRLSVAELDEILMRAHAPSISQFNSAAALV